jgi:hypothetical protein
MARLEREIKVRNMTIFFEAVAEDNLIRYAIFHHDKHASWYAEKTHGESFSL